MGPELAEGWTMDDVLISILCAMKTKKGRGLAASLLFSLLATR
jgi:hypothetical protein